MRKLITLTASLLFCSSVFAGGVVIVHPSNTASLDNKAISKIFLGKSKKFSDGSEAKPLNLESGDTSAEFTKEILGKSESQLKAYWSKLLFTGKGQAPESLASDADIIDMVSKNPNMIGYVSDSANVDSVKVVSNF
ncbi:phosphate ABC transporter substrate-binding protein [Pseudocolwellia sp. AS88]|jgi:ABC-type phosphate transport system substrate-binding protein|uniref:phosphate ABC transporter substrate-binding protein n=1 Tax=Pseudocolwellia TaxID=2848177 RepID=UPI0026F17123|nr:phosphate ABC transporter substrate-binding protein [Pseudocolwellia sp. AS88]MDO7083426.1 phosphate ABC transporter substrate-binding protein [Pseudocolwellia sp. AS88]